MVVAFVDGLTPEMSEKVAYITHVPSGSQAVLDRDGKVIHRHDGRADGPRRLDAVLDDETTMARITGALTNGEDARPGRHTIGWVPMVKFGGVDYLRRWNVAGQIAGQDYRDLTAEALGPELYRVAFRGDGYAGSLLQLPGRRRHLPESWYAGLFRKGLLAAVSAGDVGGRQGNAV